MNNAATNPETNPPVTVRRHRVDWETDDLAELTAQRAITLDLKLQQGCWYLNPRFTVSCPAPTAEFFAKVKELRSAWLRTCRQVQSKPGHRYQARQAKREGRRGALLMIDPEIATEVPHHRPGEPAFLAELPPDRRSEILRSGHLAKQLAYSGVLFIDGEIIPPHTWQTQADQLLPNSEKSLITTTHRPVDLAAFKSSSDPEPLKRMAL